MPRLKLVSEGRRALEFSEARTLVGRDVKCDRVVEVRSVSRRHAYIEERADGWHVVDLGSSTGTFINDLQVTEAPLLDGQELRLGTVDFVVEIEGTIRPEPVSDPGVETTAVMAPLDLMELPDLPAPEAAPEVKPTVDADSSAGADAEPLAAVSATAPPAPASASVPPTSAPRSAAGVSPLTMALSVLVGLLAGMAAFFFYRAGEMEKSILELEASHIVQRTDARQFATAETLEQKGALRNGSLRLCNRGALPLEVTWLGAVYALGGPSAEGADGGESWLYRAASFNSRTCDPNFKLVLPAGAEAVPQIEKCPADGRQFSGQAIFYALSVKRPDVAEPIFVSGLLSRGGDCVEIGADPSAARPPSVTEAAATPR